MKEYYPFKLIQNHQESYCIWYCSEKEGFIMDTRKVKTFHSLEELALFARFKKIKLEDYETSLSFDYATSWLQEKHKRIDSLYFLNFWNIISDVAHSVGDEFYGNSDEGKINNLYDKLLFGNNEVELKPEDKRNLQMWNDEEIFEFEKIVKDGLHLVNQYF